MSVLLKDDVPTKIGLVLFTQFEVLDVFGPIEALNMLARITTRPNLLSLTVMSKDAPQGVSDGPADPKGSGTSFAQKFEPTCSFDDPRAHDLDVLIVPGGLGAGDSASEPSDEAKAVVDYIRKVYPTLKYLITVCTGSGLAARAGVLNGHCATSNKFRWQTITPLGPLTYWVGHARWVESMAETTNGVGKIWTTSGVSAGTDGVLAWMEKVYGKEAVDGVVARMEYNRVKTPWDDPFAEPNGAQDVQPLKLLELLKDVP